MMNTIDRNFAVCLGCMTAIVSLLDISASAEQTDYECEDSSAYCGTAVQSLDGCCGSVYFSGECCDPLLTATADAPFLTRSTPAPRGVLFDINTNAEVFNFDYQTGQRLRLTRRIGATGALSIEHFGIETLDASAFFGPGNYFFRAEMDGGPDATSLDLGYETELHNVEVSLWGGMDRRFSFFGGFRWITARRLSHRRHS